MRLPYLYGKKNMVCSRLQCHLFLFGYLFTLLIRISNGYFRFLRSCRNTVYSQAVFNFRQIFCYRSLTYIVIINACHIIESQCHKPPDTTGYQADSPIPAITVRRFTAIDTNPLITMIIISRIIKTIGFPLG